MAVPAGDERDWKFAKSLELRSLLYSKGLIQMKRFAQMRKQSLWALAS